MKLKKINLDQDLDNIEVTIKLLNVLEDFKVLGAQELNEEFKTIAEDDCCGDCRNRKDECYCRQENGDCGRYMREYDDGADYED